MAKTKTPPPQKKIMRMGAEAAAIALYETRARRKEIEKDEKKLVKELLEAMHEEQLHEVASFQLSVARTLKVEDEALARSWAVEHLCMTPEKIDTSKAKEVLRHSFDDPSKYGFAVVESERIVPKGAAEDNE